MQVATTYNAVLERRDVTLGIAVARAPVGTARVQVAPAAGRLHLGEVEGAVHAAGQLGDIDVEGVLAAGEFSHLVLLLGLVQQIDAGRLGLAVDEQRHGEDVAFGGDANGAVVGHALHDAGLGAGLDRRARRGIGPAAPVAAPAAVGLVHPVRRRVQHNVVGRLGAPARDRAPVRRQLGVRLGAHRLLRGGEAG